MKVHIKYSSLFKPLLCNDVTSVINDILIGTFLISMLLINVVAIVLNDKLFVMPEQVECIRKWPEHEKKFEARNSSRLSPFVSYLNFYSEARVVFGPKFQNDYHSLRQWESYSLRPSQAHISNKKKGINICFVIYYDVGVFTTKILVLLHFLQCSFEFFWYVSP